MNYQEYIDNIVQKYHFPYPLQVMFTELKRPCVIRGNLLFIDPRYELDIIELIDEFIILHMIDIIDLQDTITITNLSMKDLKEYYDIVSNHKVCLQDASNVVKDLQEAARKLKYAKIAGKGIYIEGILVGYIGLVRKQNRVYEIGYSLNEKYWNQKIMSQAILTYTDYLLEHTLIQEVKARVFEENIPSIKVLEKAGFIYDGIEKNSLIHPMTQEIKDTLKYKKLN